MRLPVFQSPGPGPDTGRDEPGCPGVAHPRPPAATSPRGRCRSGHRVHGRGDIRLRVVAVARMLARRCGRCSPVHQADDHPAASGTASHYRARGYAHDLGCHPSVTGRGDTRRPTATWGRGCLRGKTGPRSVAGTATRQRSRDPRREPHRPAGGRAWRRWPRYARQLDVGGVVGGELVFAGEREEHPFVGVVANPDREPGEVVEERVPFLRVRYGRAAR